ncbi:MAG: DsrE family protein [Saprospiraceae bacterium]
MKKLILFAFILSAFQVLNAQTHQTLSDEGYFDNKIVFQVVTQDTVAHRSLMKQLNNIRSVAPNTEIEVVCHGPGLYMLVKDRCTVQEQIKMHAAKGVSFVACEFSLKERNVNKDDIVMEANFVRSGALEIVTKQKKGWSYLKAGF